MQGIRTSAATCRGRWCLLVHEKQSSKADLRTQPQRRFFECPACWIVLTAFDEAIRTLARSSFEFADLMRRVFPEFVIQPVQALDCGQVRPRGILKFQPNGVADDVSGDPDTMDEVLVVDLFDPPQKVADAVRVKTLLRDDPDRGSKSISEQMDISIMRAKRARSYASLMIAEGRNDPYRELTEKPASASRWKPRRPR